MPKGKDVPDRTCYVVPFELQQQGGGHHCSFGAPSLDRCHVGGCQNYGPFLGSLNIRCRIILGIQKGTLILTTTHVHTASHSAKPRESAELDFHRGLLVGSFLRPHEDCIWALVKGPTEFELITIMSGSRRKIHNLVARLWTQAFGRSRRGRQVKECSCIWATCEFGTLAKRPLDYRHVRIITKDGAVDWTPIAEVSNLSSACFGLELEKTCPCCLDEFQPDSKVAVLPCRHIFHEEVHRPLVVGLCPEGSMVPDMPKEIPDLWPTTTDNSIGKVVCLTWMCRSSA